MVTEIIEGIVGDIDSGGTGFRIFQFRNYDLSIPEEKVKYEKYTIRIENDALADRGVLTAPYPPPIGQLSEIIVYTNKDYIDVNGARRQLSHLISNWETTKDITLSPTKTAIRLRIK